MSPTTARSEGKSLGDQLRSHFSTVRPISQIIVTIPPSEAEGAFDGAIDEVLRWLARRAGRPLPPEAWERKSFELDDVGAQRVAAIGLIAPRYWAARLDDADKNVPQRVWTTEIGVACDSKGAVLVGCRLICVSRGPDAPFLRTVPGFVRQIVQNMNPVLDARSIGVSPWIVGNEEDVDALVRLLLDPQRRSNVYVLSLPEGSEDALETAVSAANLHTRTLGAAHVVTLTSSASFQLTDRLGKSFSVFRQAIRTYSPAFDPEQDEPISHPIAFHNRIADWSKEPGLTFEDFLVGQALRKSVSGADVEQRLPPFSQVRRIAAEQRIELARTEGATDAELLRLAEAEIGKLRETLDEQKSVYDGLLVESDSERAVAKEAEKDARTELASARSRIEFLEQSFRSRAAPVLEAYPPVGELRGWAEQNLYGSVAVLPRAYVGAKKSEYEDPDLIFRALLLLRDRYVPMRRLGGIELVDAFEAGCKELGLEERATFYGSRWGEEGSEYVVDYHGRKELLMRHLKKGNDRDVRNCFRLYFFWDDEDRQVVVGWLPSHLRSRIT